MLVRIAQDFESYLTGSNGWMRIGSEFMRRCGEWVQVVSFNASRFDDRYVPRSSAQFLWISGPATASALVQELQTVSDVQWWISTRDHESKRDAVFHAMQEQFRPRIDAPLDRSELVSALERDLAYWPHAYALALMAAVTGDHQGAARYLSTIEDRAKSTVNEHIARRAEELKELLEIHDPAEIIERLRPVAEDVLRQLRFPG
jgi:hypothetical protein